MSLQEEISAIAEREADAIISEAETQAAEIRRKAEERAEKAIAEATAAENRQRERAERILSSECEMKARAEAGQALESLLNGLREKVFSILEQRWRVDFAELCCGSILSAAEKMNAQEISISIPSGMSIMFADSENVIRSSLAEKKITIIAKDFLLRSRAGLVIRDKRGRKLVTDTIEENFRRMEDEIRMTLAERIGYGG